MKRSHCHSTGFLFAFFLINVVLREGKGAEAFPPSTKGLLRNNQNGLTIGISDDPERKRIALSTFLYKENHRDELPPVFSSTAAEYTSSDVANAKKALSIEADAPPIQKAFRGISSMFSFISSAVMDTVAPPDTTTEKTKKETTYKIPRTKSRTSTHNKNNQSQVVSLVDIKWLKAHEEVVSNERVHNLYRATLEWDAYRLPLLVDSASGAILDGHHRYHVGRRLGLSRLPVILVDYLNDDQIDVDVWPECGLDCLTKEEVIEMSLSDNLFPPKTSKHAFVSSFAPINVALDKLR